jgi:hypothetical protein
MKWEANQLLERTGAAAFMAKETMKNFACRDQIDQRAVPGSSIRKPRPIPSHPLIFYFDSIWFRHSRLNEIIVKILYETLLKKNT